MIEHIFKAQFNETPLGVSKAHGRVNLIGEHLDYNGGMVLPMPISKLTQVALANNNTESDVIYSENFDGRTIRQIDAPPSGHWSDYIAGALQMARSLGFLAEGVNVVTSSTVPVGAGLSSSAAVIVATLKAAIRMAGCLVNEIEVAKWAQQVEHEYIGMPCGIMDQIAVSIAEQNQAIFLDTVSLDYGLIELPPEYEFVVLHSGVSRKLDDGRYAVRRQECELAVATLGVDHLCLMNAQEYVQISELPENQMRRARHCYTEQKRTLHAAEALTRGDAHKFGEYMLGSHASMRDDFEISTPDIDQIVSSAMDAGAIGARLTGGGFGGCIVAYISKDSVSNWAKKMSSAFPNTRVLS